MVVGARRARPRLLVALAAVLVVGACSGKSERNDSGADSSDDGSGGIAGDVTGGSASGGASGGSDGATGGNGAFGGVGGVGGIGGTAGTGNGPTGGTYAGAPQGGGPSGSTGNPAGSAGAGAGFGGAGAGSGGAGSGGTPIAGSGGTPIAGSGGTTGGSMLPSCITELFDACPMTGDCANQALPGASGTLTCFASGVRVEMETPMCASAPRVERRVYRSDGMLCYKVTTQYGQACETGTETWTDGAGVTVATRGLPYMQSPSTFVCADGERSTCSGSGPSCRWSDWTTPTCEDGVCPMAREN